jgi:hypothetical protein
MTTSTPNNMSAQLYTPLCLGYQLQIATLSLFASKHLSPYPSNAPTPDALCLAPKQPPLLYTQARTLGSLTTLLSTEVAGHGIGLDLVSDLHVILCPTIRFVMSSAPRNRPSVADVPFLPYVLYLGVDPQKEEKALQFLAYLQARRGVIVIPGLFLSLGGRSSVGEK